MTNDDEIIGRLVEEKRAGRSYTEIRAELETGGMSKEEIHSLIRKVDARVLEKEIRGSAPDPSRHLYLAGLILAIAGLALTVAYSSGRLLPQAPALAIYAPFLLGILLMLYGKRFRNRTPKKESGTGAIRRQRPFK